MRFFRNFSILTSFSIFCNAADIAAETKIRLINGPTVNEGRIEVLVREDYPEIIY